MSENSAKRKFHDANAPQCNCNCDCAKAVKNLEDHFKLLTDLVVNISQKIDCIQEQNNELQPQVSVLLQAMTDQQDSIKKLVRQQEGDISLIGEFPINSAEAMTKMNMEINAQNKSQYLSTITYLLKPNGIEKQLKNILTDDFVMAHNLDGIHGKLPIKSYKNMYEIIIEAIEGAGSDSAEDQFRRALQLQKKRVFRKKSISVKTEKSVDNFESVYF